MTEEKSMKKEAVNPILPLSEYHPDGEPHVYNDRVYLFGSHDQQDGDTFCMLDYVFWSAPVDDLSDWSNKGVNYSVKQDPLYGKKMRYMYAPDVVQGNDGRYYLYYCLSGKYGKGGYANPISVAVCDTPDGKYEYLGVVRNSDGTPLMKYACFDPGLINDQGTIRLYYGTTIPWLENIQPEWLKMKRMADTLQRPVKELKKMPQGIIGAYHVVLAEDMLTAVTEPVRIDDTITGEGYAEHRFFEASSMRMINDRYYFIYSTVNNHELCYAVSGRPDGGFVYGGVIISNGDIGYMGRKPEDRLNHTGNNHGSIVQIWDQWYVFYHRPTHNSDYNRQACAEKILIQPDGRITQVQMTSCGLNQGPLQGGVYPAGICCNLTNGRMTHSTNAKKKLQEPYVGDNGIICGITSGTDITYKYFQVTGDIYLVLTARGGPGIFRTNLGGEITVPESNEWTQAGMTLHIAKGVYPLTLTYVGEGTAELKEIAFLQSKDTDN